MEFLERLGRLGELVDELGGFLWVFFYEAYLVVGDEF